MDSIIEINDYLLDLSNIKYIKWWKEDVDYFIVVIELLRGAEFYKEVSDVSDYEEVIAHYPKIKIKIFNEKQFSSFIKRLKEAWNEYRNWRTEKEIAEIVKNLV